MRDARLASGFRRTLAVAFVVGCAHVPALAAEPDDDEDIRERLTEREDKRRPLEPFSVELFGRPLTLGGKLEIEFLELRRWIVGSQIAEPDRRLLAQGLELEAFYSFEEKLSVFMQVRAALEEDLLPGTPNEVSSQWVEREEMWIASEDIGGSGFGFEAGRLDFEDDRRWWWDDELDALRISYERGTAEIALAFAREVWPRRSDVSFVEPAHDRVARVVGELSWDFLPEHGLTVFALHQNDSSRTRPVGTVIDTAKEDEPDSSLSWVGARALGAFELGAPGVLGYWLDAATLQGREHWTEYAPISDDQSVVTSVTRRDVDGWAFDAGLNWLLPLPFEPRVFAGYAHASHWFRQTGIHANEAGFGGVRRFPSYGFLLDPELSNLQIWTAGVGLSLLRSSSLDLVYHEYRLHQRADSLWNAEIELQLTGDSRAIGRELDLELALEEWERFELDVALAAFPPGAALGTQQGRWSYGSFVAIRFAF